MERKEVALTSISHFVFIYISIYIYIYISAIHLCECSLQTFDLQLYQSDFFEQFCPAQACEQIIPYGQLFCILSCELLMFLLVFLLDGMQAPIQPQVIKCS